MANREALVIPSGARLELSEAGAIVENEGDVVLNSDFGAGFASVTSRAGSVTLRGAFEAAAVVAAGDVSLGDGVVASRIEAGGSVSLSGGVRASSVSAGDAVDVEGGAAETIVAGGAVASRGATLGRVKAGGAVTASGGSAGAVEAGGAVDLEVVDVGDIEAGGSVSIQGGNPRGDITAGGDISIRGDLKLGTLDAAGAISVVGAVEATRLSAGAVRVDGPSLKVKGVRASGEISVGKASLSVDILMAPTVNVTAETTGRVAVIEADNELGPNSLKGCFSLEEFAEFAGISAEDFLTARGLSEAPVAAPTSAPAAQAPAAVAEDTPAEEAPAEEAPAESARVESARVEPAPGEPAPDEPAPDEDELDEDELESGEDTAVTAARDAADNAMRVVVPESDLTRPAEDPLQGKLMEILARIDGCYGEGDEPPAINQLRTMVSDSRYRELQEEIANIWNDLLRYHQQRSLRVPHRVTNSFNTINSLVRKM